MNTLLFEELDKLPYVKNKPTDGRSIFLRAFYDHDHDDWILYMEVEPGRLDRIVGGETVVGAYLAARPAVPGKDLDFPLGTFLTQHLSLPDVATSLDALESDFHNCSAVLEKYLLISLQPREKRDGASQLLAVELEYLITVIRSIYDLLQRLSKRATSLLKSVHEPHERIVDELPESFAKVALHGSHPRSEEDLVKRFRLPIPLAKFYIAETEHFQRLRDLRVSIEHHGQSVGPIFDLDEGMAIAVDVEPWRSLPIWCPELIRNQRLGSLRAVFAFLISQALEMTTRYAVAFASSVTLPLAIGPGYRLYLRDYFSHHLVSLTATIRSPWERQPTNKA
jgi:hypothetical protein